MSEELKPLHQLVESIGLGSRRRELEPVFYCEEHYQTSGRLDEANMKHVKHTVLRTPTPASYCFECLSKGVSTATGENGEQTGEPEK